MKPESKGDPIFGEDLGEANRDYIMKLSGYGFERLEKEPEHLNHENSKIQRKIEQLAMNSMGGDVGNLLKTLPKVQKECKNFKNKSLRIIDQRQKNKNLAQNQTQILEILELPTLMSSCVTDGLFAEALELKSHGESLLRRFPDIPLLQKINKEMESVAKQIKKELLASLENRIQLPVCLKNVEFLRQMRVFDEQSLRKEFLNRQYIWVNSQLAPFPAEPNTRSVYEYLKKYLDTHKTQVFEIVTRYRALFVDDSNTLDAEISSDSDRGLLFRWVFSRVSDILSCLKSSLPLIDDGSYLSDILYMSMKCGITLGHVGIDFRGLLVPIFEARVISLFTEGMSSCCDSFALNLRIQDWYITSDTLAQVGMDTDSPIRPSKQGELVPPKALLEFPPLAILANGFILSFNELTQCAPTICVSDIVEETQKASAKITKILFSVEPDESKKDIFKNLSRCFALRLLPFISEMLNRVFSKSALLKLTEIQRNCEKLYLDPVKSTNGQPEVLPEELLFSSLMVSDFELEFASLCISSEEFISRKARAIDWKRWDIDFESFPVDLQIKILSYANVLTLCVSRGVCSDMKEKANKAIKLHTVFAGSDVVYAKMLPILGELVELRSNLETISIHRRWLQHELADIFQCIRNSHRLKSLEMYNSNLVISPILHLLASESCAENLVVLKLGEQFPTEFSDLFRALGDSCTKLEELQLRNGFDNALPISSWDDLRYFLERQPRLKTLDIDFRGIGRECLALITEPMVNLTHLTIPFVLDDFKMISFLAPNILYCDIVRYGAPVNDEIRSLNESTIHKMELFRYLPRECFKRMKFASFVGSTICTDQSMQHFPCEYLDTHRKLCFFRSKIGDGTIKKLRECKMKELREICIASNTLSPSGFGHFLDIDAFPKLEKVLIWASSEELSEYDYTDVWRELENRGIKISDTKLSHLFSWAMSDAGLFQ